jgi:hypothetical protein
MLVETVVVPVAAPASAAPANYGVNPPALIAEPVTASVAEPDWGEDVNRVDVRAIDRDPSRPRKRRRVYGAVSLIPGLDDFYLALIVLGAVWLVLGILLVVSPKFCWLAIISGFLIWVGATFWLRLAIEEADPVWKWLVFIPFFAAFFAIYHRDRALRAFLVSMAGLCIVGMGAAALRRNTPVQEPDPPPAVFGDPFGP